jgi:hypothetical protein
MDHELFSSDEHRQTLTIRQCLKFDKMRSVMPTARAKTNWIASCGILQV